MFVIRPISATRLNQIRMGALVVAFACASVGCTSKPSNPIPPIAAKTPEQLCADAGYDPNVFVFLDKSSEYRLAAVGVTGSGNLEEFAAIVGPSVVTTRGGATVTGGSNVDVSGQTCDKYK